MDWQQLELDLAAAQLARAEALLSILGAASITLAPCGGDEILEPEPGTTPVWTATTVRALFPASIDVERVAAWLSESLGDRVAIRVALLPETAWAGALA
ncbi:MAG TPA: 50S ribosomal protein L11 methyltransferase, partial [Gammaproteobacteria bacterium]|nr:50S ribosomal protein L11 methyltransferase [Gammaproteobacteria bacterium]